MADLPAIPEDINAPLPESPDPELTPYRLARLDPGASQRVYTTGWARRPVQPPQGVGGVQMPDLGDYAQQMLQHYPIEEAKQRISMATKYLAQRGYQADTQAGMTQPDAMSKWGYLLFGDQPGGAAAVIRATQPAPPKLHFGSEGEVLRQNPDGTISTVRPARPGFEPAAVQGFPVMDPDTNKAIPEFFATPSPSGKGMTVHLKRPAGEMKPDQALKWLGKLPDLELDYPGIRSTLEPVLRARAESVAPKKEIPAPNKPTGPLAVGTVKGGFRYKGGDPSKKENWEKYPG